MPDNKQEIHKGHRERVKKRFLKSDLDDFEPHQVLEMLLFYCNSRKDTNEAAHKLINEFGSFVGVLDADYEQLCKVEGVGEHTAVLLKMIPSLARYYQTSKQRKSMKVLLNADQMKAFLAPYFIGRREECIMMLCLNNGGEVLGVDLVQEGSVNEVPVDIGKVLKIALDKKASCVVISHNHPDTIALPTPEDIFVTRNISQALKLVNVSLLDHLIFDSDGSVSLRETNRLDGII